MISRNTCCGQDDGGDCITAPNSQIVRRNNTFRNNNGEWVTDDSEDTTNKQSGSSATVRYGHIDAILPLTFSMNGQLIPADMAVYIQAGSYLAFEHFNRRSGEVLSYLPDRLKDCDFYWSWEHHNTMFSPIHAAGTLLEEQQESEYCSPFAVVGAARSAVTYPLAILGGALKLPIISPVSTSINLEGLPYFSRSLPTNSGDAQAFAMHLDHFNVSHVAVLYIQDEWGISFHGALATELQHREIKMLSMPYRDSSVNVTMQQLAESQYRYIVAFINRDSWKEIFQLGYEYGIMGHPGYTWIFGEGIVNLFDPSFNIDRADITLAKALHGASLIMMENPTHEAFEQSLWKIVSNSTIQEQFVKKFKQPQFFYEYNFSFPVTSLYSYTSYDAVMALGMAACDTPGLFTSDEFFETLLQSKFEGVSGSVFFDHTTHTRSTSSVVYSTKNILLSEERSTPTQFFFTNRITSEIHIGNDSIRTIAPYVYADNSTQQPAALPSLALQQNLVPMVVHIFGFILGGLVLLSSLGWFLWTLYHRTSHVVRASQPIFLCQLCVGTFLMGISVIPMSFQEPKPRHQLDAACMSLPWLLSIGFVTAFSALFSKTWRLNRLFKGSIACRRIQVKPTDVLWPFLVLMTINVSLLVGWTVMEPLHWGRIDVSNYDAFSRIQESYGDCQLRSQTFLTPLLTVNFIAVCQAAYQSFVARNLPVEFSESYYLALSMASLLETAILSVPVLFAAVGNPTASYILRSLFVCMLSLTILLPIFVPKYWQHQRKIRGRGNSNGGIAFSQQNGTVVVRSRDVGSSEMGRIGGLRESAVSAEESDRFDITGRTNGMSRIRRSSAYYEQISN